MQALDMNEFALLAIILYCHQSSGVCAPKRGLKAVIRIKYLLLFFIKWNIIFPRLGGLMEPPLDQPLMADGQVRSAIGPCKLPARLVGPARFRQAYCVPEDIRGIQPCLGNVPGSAL